MRTWNRTDEVLPTDGSEVRTISPSGREATLVYDRGLWWLPDKSMYMYYTPMLWRHL